MAIGKHQRSDCPNRRAERKERTDCECPWRLNYRPLGTCGPHKRLNFPTKRAAQNYLAETTTQATRGQYVNPTVVPTFAEAADRWFASKADRRASHLSTIQSLLKHLLPRLGAQRLDRITVVGIERVRNALRAEGYKHRTIVAVIRICGAVFRGAVRRGECTANPVERLERNHTAARELGADEDGGEALDEHNILNPAEVRRLLDSERDGYLFALASTAFITGMRQGELLALRWSDIDLAGARIAVRRSVTWARPDRDEPSRPRFYEPKTRSGLRSISIPAALVSVLRRWQLQCPPSALGLAFPAEDGQPGRCAQLLRLEFYPALRRARLRRVTFHSLRHSCASAMIANGATITEVQNQLGHASPAITLGVYSHWFKNAESGASTTDKLAATVLTEKPALRMVS